MGILKNMASYVKQVMIPDDENGLGIDDDMFEEEDNKLPKIGLFNSKKSNNRDVNNRMNSMPSFNSQNINFNSIKLDQNKKSNSGHIQVYVPKSYEQAFEIAKDVKDGVTAMVNVEACNPQISQRIVDVISGAIFALGGQCKKSGEKQYLFSLNAQMEGAAEFLPVDNGYIRNNTVENNHYNMQNPFSFMDYQNFDNNQNFQNYNNDMYSNGFNNQNFNNQNFNNQNNNNQGFNPQFNNQTPKNNMNGLNAKKFYIPPQQQF